MARFQKVLSYTHIYTRTDQSDQTTVIVLNLCVLCVHECVDVCKHKRERRTDLTLVTAVYECVFVCVSMRVYLCMCLCLCVV